MASVTGSKPLLDSFEPTESPKWREQISSEHGEIPKTSQMVKEISDFVSKYKTLEKGSDLREKRRKALRELLISYLFNIQHQEKIGVNDASKTEEIINEMDEKDTNIEKVFQSFPSVEAELPQIYESLPQNKKEMIKIRETQNLYSAFNHLMQELEKNRNEYDNERDFKPSIGLLEVDTIIVETHEKVMTELIDDNKTGVFSTCKRISLFNDREVHYPIFCTENIAREAVLTIVDLYNGMVPEVNSCDDFDSVILLKLFKRASMFLYSFLELHPFADGNGRLARLLSSYSLRRFSPFMTTVYNVFSPSNEQDYIKALVNTRRSEDLELSKVIDNEEKVIDNEEKVIDNEEKSKEFANYLMNQPPKDLCAMLIESNWSMWRQFLYKLGEGWTRN